MKEGFRSMLMGISAFLEKLLSALVAKSVMDLLFAAPNSAVALALAPVVNKGIEGMIGGLIRP
ncbi:MAG: hypothetical protein IPF79_04535, partial [Ignavibacteria bacterium]|nr:hypothetical protein [Ignavibacteria bacterium]